MQYATSDNKKQRCKQCCNLRNKFLSFSVINKLWHGEGINHCEDIIPETNNTAVNWLRKIDIFNFLLQQMKYNALCKTTKKAPWITTITLISLANII